MIILIQTDPQLPQPAYQTNLSAGIDLPLLLDTYLPPGVVTICNTGVVLSGAMDGFYELQLRMRSSLAKAGIFLANGVATIDADYKLPIQVLLYNSNTSGYEIGRGERVVQAILCPVLRLDNRIISKQRDGGLGSTGI